MPRWSWYSSFIWRLKLLRFLGKHGLAMILLIAEDPQVMKITPNGVYNREETSTTTPIGHAMGTKIFILKVDPVT